MNLRKRMPILSLDMYIFRLRQEGVNFNFFIVHTVEAAKVARTREPFLSIYKLDSLSVSDQAAVFRQYDHLGKGL